MSTEERLRRLAFLGDEEAHRELDRLLLRQGGRVCEGYFSPCASAGATKAPVRTQYYWDGKGENPNKPPILCADCMEAYNDHWDEMWADYHAGLGV